MGRWHARPDCIKCGAPYHALDMCRVCYRRHVRARARLGLPSSDPPPPKDPCPCGRADTLARGLCQACYKREHYRARMALLPNNGRCTQGYYHEWLVTGVCRKCRLPRP
jgi:NMD protein affecting ribosome stability and mRNA decay